MNADAAATSSTSLGTWLGSRSARALVLVGRALDTKRSPCQTVTGSRSARAGGRTRYASRRSPRSPPASAAYDTGQDDQPAGKLHLLAQLDWLRGVLRGGQRAFDPVADRPAFDQHLRSLGCRAPDQRPLADPPPNPEHAHHRDQVAAELQATQTRLHELKARERLLRAACRA